MSGIKFHQWLAYAAEHFPDLPLPLTSRQLNQALAREAMADMDNHRWVSTAEAQRLTGMPGRSLRYKADGWTKMMGLGQQPEIRVRKASDKPHAPWLFLQADCRVYGVTHGHSPPTPRSGSQKIGAEAQNHDEGKDERMRPNTVDDALEYYSNRAAII